MVLRGLDVPQAETLLAEAMEASDLGESVWTPDLLRILLHCGLRAQLYSICLLPNPGYAQLSCMHCNCLSLVFGPARRRPLPGALHRCCAGYLSEERRLNLSGSDERIKRIQIDVFQRIDEASSNRVWH
uniref:Uncharacterized protein n=1 Tax=Macrostomum lignano TaxID=282301 RepID=A0A1I8FGY4_9PLAT